MGDVICIDKKSISKKDISSMTFEDQLKSLKKIQEYKNFLDQREEYIEDVSSLQYPKRFASRTDFIDFGDNVSIKEVLSFLKKING